MLFLETHGNSVRLGRSALTLARINKHDEPAGFKYVIQDGLMTKIHTGQLQWSSASVHK